MKKASQGPKQRAAFRDNYLAAIIAVAAFFLSFTASAQTPKRSQMQQINATGYTYKAGEYRIVAYFPLDTAHGADSGAIAYKAGKLWISKDTIHWEPYGKATQLNDSSFVVGRDTITIRGTGGADNSISSGSRTATGDYTQNWNGHQLVIDSAGSYLLDTKVKTSGTSDQVGMYSHLNLNPTEVRLYGEKAGTTRSFGFYSSNLLSEMFATGYGTNHDGYVQADTMQIILESDPNRFYVFHDSAALININGGNMDFRIRTLPTTTDTNNYKPLVIGPAGAVLKSSVWPSGGGGGSADSVKFSTNYRRDTAIANVRAEKNFKLGWFDIKDFGAVGDSVTDCTTPIQNAILAAKAHGGGVVYFPNGFYRIGGSIISTVGGRPCHCQLYIPYTPVDSAIVIEFKAESPGNFEFQGVTGVNPPKTGVILESSLSSASAGDAIIANVKGPGDDTWFKTNGTDPWFHGINFRVRRDAGAFPLSGINTTYASKVKMDFVKVDVNMALSDIPDPTGTGSIGIILPEKSNHASIDIGTIRVGGFDVGLQLGEHAVIKDYQNAANNVGMTITNGDHSASIQTFEGELNKTNIRVDGDMNVAIVNFNTEHYNGYSGAKWYNYVQDITFSSYTPYSLSPGTITIGAPNAGVSGAVGVLSTLETNDTSRITKLSGGTWINRGILMTNNPSATSETNVIKGLNSSTSLGIVAGGANNFDCNTGPFLAMRGNTYSAISTQRGNLYIGSGNPSSPASGEGAINFFTGNSINRLTIKNDGVINISKLATGVSPISTTGETRILMSDGNGDIAFGDPAIQKHSQNNATGFEVQNPNTGTSAEAYVAVRNNVGYAALELFGSNHSSNPATLLISSDAANGLKLATISNAPIKIHTNSDGVTNERARFTGAGAFLIGRTSLIGSELLSVNGKINANADSVGTATGGYLFRDAATGEFKIAPAGGSGITSINSQTGPAVTIQSGTGTSVTNTTNTVTIEVNTSSNALPHTLNKQYSAVGNTGTSESDLYTYTVPGNTMNTDGQSVHFDAAGLFNDATATVALQFYFAGTSFANTTALTISVTGKWSASGYIIRTGSTTATAWVTISSNVTTDKSYTYLADLTGLDFTAGNVFKVTGQAGGGGGSTNDITAKTWVVRYQPL